MYTVISILIVIASIFLTIFVLLQNSKGGGLAANFAAGNQTFGVRQTADFLEKSTWTLAITIIVLCVMATAFISDRAVDNKSNLIEKLENQMPTGGQPQFPVEAKGDQKAQATTEAPAQDATTTAPVEETTKK